MSEENAGLTHFDAEGRAHMVDVGGKSDTRRIARASGRIVMLRSTLELIESGRAGKGDVLGIARIAAIQGAKRTSELIPLCHPLPLTRVAIAETVGKTGVEMEALTAVSVGLLTIYDMCKAVDRGMRIGPIGLDEKSGGKSGTWRRDG